MSRSAQVVPRVSRVFRGETLTVVSRDDFLFIQIHGRLMLTSVGNIDGEWQTIYGTHTDPSWVIHPDQ